MPTNVGRAQGTRLCSRALLLGDQGGVSLAYVCLDLCFISGDLRKRVLSGLRRQGHAIDSERLILTATHTHSSLGGYVREVFYAASVPGFSEANTAAIVEAVVTSVRTARERMRPARVFVHEGELHRSTTVAYNRSLSAYNRNHDVRPLTEAERHDAVNRRVTVLRVDSLEPDVPMSIVSWFGLHGTCVHADHHVFHADHPGATADHVEAEAAQHGWPEVVAIASQSVCGDVTPNHRFDPARKRRVGDLDDDFAAARRVGRIVGERVLELAREAPWAGVELDSHVVCSLTWTDPAGAAVAAEFAYGRVGRTTEPPTLGLAFSFGTAEGPGPARRARPLQRTFRRAIGSLPRHLGLGRRWAKIPLWTLGPDEPGRVLGFIPIHGRVLSLVPNRFLRYIGREVSVHGTATPWVPRTLPSHMVRIGSLMLCAVPFEPTTHAGERLRRTVWDNARDLTHVVVCGYANDYASYMTTDEEYLEQAYEGASTLFGRWTLAAWQTLVGQQVAAMTAGHPRLRTSEYEGSVRTQVID